MRAQKFYKHKITNLINVQKIVTVHYQALTPGYASEEEAHDFWELIYADKRGVSVSDDGKTFPLSQGYAVFLPPDCRHFVVSREDANIFIVSFDCRSEALGLLAHRVIEIPPARRELLQTVMSEALGTFRIPDFDPKLHHLELLPHPYLGGEQAIKNALELLLIYLLRNESEAAPPCFYSQIEGGEALRDAIMQRLNEKIYGRISLDELSAELHYGKTTLCTLFREQTGKTIYNTFLELKIGEAKRLVRKGRSAQEISDRLGFSSQSHFIAVFRKFVGRTPAEYKKSVKQ